MLTVAQASGVVGKSVLEVSTSLANVVFTALGEIKRLARMISPGPSMAGTGRLVERAANGLLEARIE
jgi:hypothetical protein